MNIKNDFSIFKNNPGIIYLDNAATTLKPDYVIDGITNYLLNDYANIHRGAYLLSEKSENLYFQSKEIVANNIGGRESEIIYTYNSTYAFNILASTLVNSGFLKKGDKILLTISEHHANIVPWLILKDTIGIEIDYIKLDENYQIDFEDFKIKYDNNVKLVSVTQVSNVTGTILDVKKLGSLLSSQTLYCIDGSQAIPNFKVNVNDYNCHFYIFTGHKVMASTGIGVLWIKKDILKLLKPSIGGGGSIQKVGLSSFTYLTGFESFEPGTPNLVGAVSLLKAFEYIDSIGGYDKLFKYENELTKYALEKFNQNINNIQLIGSINHENRVGVFSFYLKNGVHPNRIGEIMSDNNICIRCGGHCAHPLHDAIGLKSTCRISLYIYNSYQDIDAFFDVIKENCT